MTSVRDLLRKQWDLLSQLLLEHGWCQRAALDCWLHRRAQFGFIVDDQR